MHTHAMIQSLFLPPVCFVRMSVRVCVQDFLDEDDLEDGWGDDLDGVNGKRHTHIHRHASERPTPKQEEQPDDHLKSPPLFRKADRPWLSVVMTHQQHLMQTASASTSASPRLIHSMPTLRADTRRGTRINKVCK